MMSARTVAHSPTLAFNERLRARRAAGLRVISLGFGEAGLPVLPAVADVLAAAAGHNAYGAVAGSPAARAAVAGYFSRRGLPTDADDVILAPGSKPLLFAILAVLPGDVILPRPSWVSYAAQAALVGKRVITVAISETAGGVPDPDRLDESLRAAEQAGATPKILIATLPDNPTGTLPEPAVVNEICEIADRHDLVIVSDEIYRDLNFGTREHLRPAAVRPERTIVTGGLSKNMALGGWRIGFARLPANPWGRRVTDSVTGVASEVWSSLSAPMHAAAAFVLDEPPEVAAHITASGRLHHAVVTAVRHAFVAAGATCREPHGAFYLYPDFDPLRPTLRHHNIHTGQQFADHLLDRYGIGVLAGHAFGDDPHALRFRVATSLLYGDGDQRWQALRSPDPTALPWIAEALAELNAALTALGRGTPH